MRSGPLAARWHCSGQALIVTLVVLAFITSVMSALSLSLLLDVKAAERHNRRVQAYYLARSGAEVAMHELLRDDPSVDALADPWCRDGSTPMKANLGDGEFHVDAVSEVTGKGRAGIVDEERKLNINKADPAMLRNLHPAMTTEIVQAIVARRSQRPFECLGELAALPETPKGFLTLPRKDAPAGLESLLTVHGEGKINVNTAPLAVLRSVESIGPERAGKLIGLRNGEDGEPGTEDDRPFATVREIQQRLEMDGAPFAGARPWVAVTSRHFTIVATGSVPGKRPTVRRVRQVVRRDNEGIRVERFEQVR